MNKSIAALTLLLASNAFASAHAATDREQVLAAIDCFITWDREGGDAESVAPCLSTDVVYQRVNDRGELLRYTPGFDYQGKGLDDYVPYITEAEIFGNMAIVKTHKHRSAPKRPYMKAFILYRLREGWRITNVVWGGITPER
ncbi:MAG: hypothetical protein AAGA95_09000 [Pseudomonadota bacterium]